jgi:hypothetical protein
MRFDLKDSGFAPRMSRAKSAIAAILIITANGMSVAAWAQSDPVPQTNVHRPLPAPVGHRQPHAWDLPPDVLRHEGMSQLPPEAAPAARSDTSPDQTGRAPFDDDMQVCRGC